MKKAIQLIHHTYAAHKLDLLKIISVGLVFAIVKLAGFSTAILLSQLVNNVSHYGTFEFALALGIVLALFFNGGLQAAYPYFNLKQQRLGYRSIFFAHSLIVGFIVLGILLVNRVFELAMPQKYLIALLFGGIIAMQTMMSTILKSHDKILQAVFLDGGALLIVTFYIVFLMLNGGYFDFDVLQTLHTGYLVLLMGVFAFNWWNPKNDFTVKRYGRAIDYARPVVIASILIIGLTGSARILAEWFFGGEAVGYYAFYLRFAMLTIMLQQVFIVAFFRRIYQSDPAILDKYFSGFIAIAMSFSLLSFWLMPYLLWGKLNMLNATFYDYRILYLILSCHAVVWTALALNENVIHRESLSTAMSKSFAIILFLMLATMCILYQMDYLNLFNFSIINAIALFAAVESQHHILAQIKVDFRHMKTALRICMLIFGLLYFII